MKRTDIAENQETGTVKADRAIVALVCGLWLLLALFAWIKAPGSISLEERRTLAQRPALSVRSVLAGTFMDGFEEYAKDQFPARFGFRSLKASVRYHLLGYKDNNDIYIEDGIAAKLDYPLNDKSVQTALNRFQWLYDAYLEGTQTNVYAAVIPDKHYYLGARMDYPSMDYDRLFSMIEDGMPYAEYIDIADSLTIEDFYRTDIHWRQERLWDVAGRIGQALGTGTASPEAYVLTEADELLLGAYYGQSALRLIPDRVVYAENAATGYSRVFNVETDAFAPVYDVEKLSGRDPYDVYLSGAAALLVVENPEARTDCELVVFRDSFASSLIPLLLEAYSRVTLVDIRYIRSELVGEYVDFVDQDVLFIYNALLLNSANVLK
ncbi:MAG TPA: hypothetical protein GX688_01165 [Clostridiales bacterium]|nr:hypothetical protein [Clostridiales bacterium]